ncbi:MAG TPA: DUF6600 domain-containing protein [Terriglobales bacterium]|nr:DUF6600 domain-containing protein [Terriglobales bacterium]
MKRYLAVLAAVLVMTAASYAGAPQLQPGVARVSLLHGDVTTQRGDSGDWVNAGLNTPLTAGDKVATGPDSRAEIQLDYANVLRLADNANASIADLTRDRIQVQLGLGLADFSQLRDSNANIEIDTPNIAVRPLRPGVYRIQVNSATETQVIVREGEAEVTTPQGSTRVQSGQQITVEGTTNPEYQTVSAPQRDDWDRWNSDRDSLISRATSWRYTNQYYTGSQDLDDYGRWVNVPDYGPVWSPAVGPGWAPYSYGNWVWEPYYGWTWVSNEPWGWAPYHYGRWFLYGSSWCWWPGPVYGGYYPVWAPAYVSFFGFGFGGGFNFGVGFGFGNIGWLPIGPGDFYHPWYGRGVNVVNVTNITNIYNNYGGYHGYRGVAPLYRGRNGYSNLRNVGNNPRLLGSVSTLPGRDFGRVPVRRATGIDAATFRHGGMLTGRVPVVPSRASLGTPARPANNRVASNQHFFTRGRGAAVRPVSFNHQVTQMQNIMRNSAPKVTAQANRLGLARQQPGGMNSSANATRGRGGMQQFGGNSNSARNAQSFGRNNSAAAQPGRQGQANTARSGWNSFGGNGNRGNGAQSFGRGNNAAQTARPGNAGNARGDWRPFNGSGAQNNSPRMQNGGNRNFGPSQGNVDRGGARTPQGPQSQPRSGWRSFSNSGDRGPVNAGGGNQNSWRPAPSAGSSGQGQRGGSQNSWRPFSQGSGQDQTRGQSGQVFRGNGGQGQSSRGASRQGWQTFSNSGRSGRPALDLQQPIVTRRPSDNYGRGSQGTYRNNSGGYYGGGRQAAPTREYGNGSSWGRGAYGGSGNGGYSDRGSSVGNRGGYSGGGGRSAGSWGGGGGSRGGYSGGGGGGHYSGGGGGGGRPSGGGGGSHASGGSSHGNSHR